MSMHIRLSPLRDLFNVYSLKAFIILCVLWFSSSAITSTTAKLVITKHDFPITLTLVQFAFISVALLCFNQFGIFIKILPVCRNSLSYSAYLSVLQIIGHVLSSAAISYVTVSFHHTIKALAPIFTVIIYRFVYQTHYGIRIYLSLLILTSGVMLTCVGKIDFNTFGFTLSILSTLTFVVQAIFSKKIFNSILNPNTILKLDKMNLIFYSYTIGTLIILPFWFLMDYPVLTPVSSLTAFHYFMCAFAHFCQNICAFTVLSIVTPVTYSIGGLVKRIVVIGSSIVILGDNIGFVQGLGIVLTFLGVGMYDRFKLDLKQGRENNILPIVR